MIRTIVLFALLAGQQQDPMKILIQLRHKVAQSISHVPRYLCTEVVQRQQFEIPSKTNKPRSCPELLAAAYAPKAKLQPASSDRLRLDVTVLDNQEAYSWVGEDRFADQSLSELVQTGMTSTGSFDAYLQAIFVGDVATFKFLGESERKGRRILQYGFRVPLWRSSYRISTTRVTRLTGYSGAFTADAETLDLLNLEIHGDDIPLELNMCEAVTSLDYTKLRINNIDFLLPAEANTSAINSNGTEARNQVVFSGCHQFTGESTLLFDDQPAKVPGTLATAATKTLTIPRGVPLFVALTEKIDPAVASAGDVVNGRLTKQISIAGSIIPKGTLLNGRICELSRQYGDFLSLTLGLKWESIEFGGIKQTLQLELESAIPGAPKVHDVRVRASDPTIGYFHFSDISRKFEIPAGFEARWLSLNPQ